MTMATTTNAETLETIVTREPSKTTTLTTPAATATEPTTTATKQSTIETTTSGGKKT